MTMTMSLLNAEDLSSLLVFDTLSSDWVREVHMFKSQRRKKENTFVIFRNFRNKKISSLEELKEEFDDADFLDNAQFKSGQSHDIVSSKVGANKTARTAAKAWMAEAAKRPTPHQPEVLLVPKNINEKALNKEVKLKKVNKNTSDDATLLNVVKAIKPAIPELEKVPVTKSAVATAQVKPSVMETVEVSKAPPIRTELIKHEAATPIVKPAVPIKKSDAEETRENIQVASMFADAIKPAFAGLPFGSNADVKDFKEKPNQTAVTTKDEEDMIREEKEQKQNPNKVISCHETGLVEVLQTFLAESENDAAGRAVEVASKQVEVKKDEEDSKLGTDLPTFFDIENKSDESDETDGSSDESINDDTDDLDLGSLEEAKYLKEDFLQNKPDENISGIKKPGHDKFSTEDTCMKVGKTEIEENPLLLVQTSKPVFAGLPIDDSADAWMHDDVGIIDDDEDNEEENFHETIPQYKSGLVEVLQTFLTESENPAAGSTSEAASKQVVVKTDEEDSKLGTDLETFFDDEDNDTDESDEPDSNRDESLNYDIDESELGSSESASDPESDIEPTLDSKPKENGLK